MRGKKIPTNINLLNLGLFMNYFLLNSNIKKEIYNVLESFFTFKKKNETKKIYNTLFLCKGQDKNTTWKVVKTILEN